MAIMIIILLILIVGIQYYNGEGEENKGSPPPSNQSEINRIRDAGMWSLPTQVTQCTTYTFPISFSDRTVILPRIDYSSVPLKSSVPPSNTDTNSTCVQLDQIALRQVSQTCNFDKCFTADGTIVEKGYTWNHYQPCNLGPCSAPLSVIRYSLSQQNFYISYMNTGDPMLIGTLDSLSQNTNNSVTSGLMTNGLMASGASDPITNGLMASRVSNPMVNMNSRINSPTTNGLMASGPVINMDSRISNPITNGLMASNTMTNDPPLNVTLSYDPNRALILEVDKPSNDSPYGRIKIRSRGTCLLNGGSIVIEGECKDYNWLFVPSLLISPESTEVTAQQIVSVTNINIIPNFTDLDSFIKSMGVPVTDIKTMVMSRTCTQNCNIAILPYNPNPWTSGQELNPIAVQIIPIDMFTLMLRNPINSYPFSTN